MLSNWPSFLFYEEKEMGYVEKGAKNLSVLTTTYEWCIIYLLN